MIQIQSFSENWVEGQGNVHSLQETEQQSYGFCKSYFPEEGNKHSKNVTTCIGHRMKKGMGGGMEGWREEGGGREGEKAK